MRGRYFLFILILLVAGLLGSSFSRPLEDEVSASDSTSTATSDLLWMCWSYKIGDVKRENPTFCVAEGKVYASPHDGTLYCLNAYNGSLMWTYTTGGDVFVYPVTVAHGKVYLGSKDKKIYCLDASTGTLIWSYMTGDEVWVSPQVADQKAYVCSLDGLIYCFNASHGALLWSYNTSEPHVLVSPPAIADGKIFVGGGFDVYCLNASTGILLWNNTISGSVGPIAGSFKVYDNRIYLQGLMFDAYCLNASNGMQIWHYFNKDCAFFTGQVADGRTYLHSKDHHVYCLNAYTGEQIWNYTIEGLPQSALFEDKIYVYSTTTSNLWVNTTKILCVNASTGTLIWNYTSSILPYPILTVIDDTFYMSCVDYRLYAFCRIWLTLRTHGVPSDAPVTITKDGAPIGQVHDQSPLTIKTNTTVTIGCEGELPSQSNENIRYQFMNWTGDVANNTNNMLSLTLTATGSITAHYTTRSVSFFETALGRGILITGIIASISVPLLITWRKRNQVKSASSYR